MNTIINSSQNLQSNQANAMKFRNNRNVTFGYSVKLDVPSFKEAIMKAEGTNVDRLAALKELKKYADNLGKNLDATIKDWMDSTPPGLLNEKENKCWKFFEGKKPEEVLPNYKKDELILKCLRVQNCPVGLGGGSTIVTVKGNLGKISQDGFGQRDFASSGTFIDHMKGESKSAIDYIIDKISLEILKKSPKFKEYMMKQNKLTQKAENKALAELNSL